MKSVSYRVTNNEISGKFTHTPMHQDLAVTLMDTSGYFYNFIFTNPCYYLFPRTPSILVHNSEY